MQHGPSTRAKEEQKIEEFLDLARTIVSGWSTRQAKTVSSFATEEIAILTSIAADKNILDKCYGRNPTVVLHAAILSACRDYGILLKNLLMHVPSSREGLHTLWGNDTLLGKAVQAAIWPDEQAAALEIIYETGTFQDLNFGRIPHKERIELLVFAAQHALEGKPEILSVLIAEKQKIFLKELLALLINKAEANEAAEKTGLLQRGRDMMDRAFKLLATFVNQEQSVIDEEEQCKSPLRDPSGRAYFTAWPSPSKKAKRNSTEKKELSALKPEDLDKAATHETANCAITPSSPSSKSSSPPEKKTTSPRKVEGRTARKLF